MNGRMFQFELYEVKASANARKHSVSFRTCHTVFNDPRLLTMADLEHSETTSGVLSRLLHKRLDSFRGLPLVRREAVMTIRAEQSGAAGQ